MTTRFLEDSCSYLRDGVPQIIDKYNSRYGAIGLQAKVGDVLRSTEDQQTEYAKGRTVPGKIVTYADGVENLSNHQKKPLHGENCSHAVDVLVLADNGKRYVPDQRYYLALLGLGIWVGLKSGLDWSHPDAPHLECPYAQD